MGRPKVISLNAIRRTPWTFRRRRRFTLSTSVLVILITAQGFCGSASASIAGRLKIRMSQWRLSVGKSALVTHSSLIPVIALGRGHVAVSRLHSNRWRNDAWCSETRARKNGDDPLSLRCPPQKGNSKLAQPLPPAHHAPPEAHRHQSCGPNAIAARSARTG